MWAYEGISNAGRADARQPVCRLAIQAIVAAMRMHEEIDAAPVLALGPPPDTPFLAADWVFLEPVE
jgi:hypothetical protein